MSLDEARGSATTTELTTEKDVNLMRILATLAVLESMVQSFLEQEGREEVSAGAAPNRTQLHHLDGALEGLLKDCLEPGRKLLAAALAVSENQLRNREQATELEYRRAAERLEQAGPFRFLGATTHGR